MKKVIEQKLQPNTEPISRTVKLPEHSIHTPLRMNSESDRRHKREDKEPTDESEALECHKVI